MRVATLNIWGRQGPWPDRLRVLRRELAALAPDLLALQEVYTDALAPSRNQGHGIADGLGYWVAWGESCSVRGSVRMGNALLSRFPVAHAEAVWLPRVAGRETRSLLACELTTPAGPWSVFVTHLDWEPHAGQSRQAQLAFVTAEIDRRATTGGLPPLLLGDLNAGPDSDEVRFLRGQHAHEGRSVYYADCFALAGDGDGATYCRTNRFAAVHADPDRRIDYILSRVDGATRCGWPTSARLVFAHPDGEIYPSDHYGVYAELEGLTLDK